MLATRLQGSASGRGVATDNNRQQEPDGRCTTDRCTQQQMAEFNSITCQRKQAPERYDLCFPDILGTIGYFSGITFMGITVHN